MSWVAPTTWTTGYVVLATDLNREIRDNIKETAHIVASDVVVAEVTNDSTDTPVFQVTLNDNIRVGSDGLWRITAIGDCLNNTGSDRVLRVTPSFGGSSVAQWDVTLPSNANRRAVLLEVLIAAANSTAAQRIVSRLTIGGVGSAGSPPAQVANTENSVQETNASAIDTTGGAVILLVSVKWPIADPALSYKQHSVHVEGLS